MKALLLHHADHRVPEALARAVRDSAWEVVQKDDATMAFHELGEVDAVLLAGPLDSAHQVGSTVIDQLAQRNIPTFVIGDGHASPLSTDSPFIEWVGADFSALELRGRLAMIERYRAHVARLEGELAHMARLSRQLSDHFQDLDQEMRLAARLQRGFLPELEKPLGRLRFATLFRPATWVSGDIYDVFRVDDEHVGFYLADAVGHGVASGLLTMFIRQGMTVGCREHGGELPSPADTLSRLNTLLIRQALPNCQFVTAWFGVLNQRTLALRYARAGHPYPVFLGADGSAHELQSDGGLLGIVDNETYEEGSCRLAPGDRLVIYSDGLECALPAPPSAAATSPLNFLRNAAGESVTSLAGWLEHHLNTLGGSLAPQDDVTVLALQVAGEPQPQSS